jgi:hypothetical protein
MQKYVFKGIPVLFLVVLSILSIHLSGCDESGTVDPNTNQQVIALLTGNVVSFWGEPKANIKVSTDSATVYTDAQGNFSIPNVAAPYNLYISDSARSEYNVMKDLTAEQVKFVFTASPYGGFTNTCGLKVIVPQNAMGNVNTAKFVFTDGMGVNGYGSVNSSVFEQIRINGYNTITSRVYVLGYRVVNNKIEAYENFGYKDVTLTTGGQVTVNFDSADVAFNPDESTVSGTFTNYEPAASLYRVFSISFGENYTPNYSIPISFEQSGSTANFDYAVPSNLPVFFKPMVYMQSSTPQSTQRNRRLIIDPGTTGGSYPLATEPTLLEPQTGANVNLSTPFTFTQGSEEGIYILRIYNGQISYSIYTDDLSTTLESLSKLGFSLAAGTTYTWSVIKIGPNSTLNDYVGNPLRLSQFSSTSESRTFTGQ